MYNNVRKIRVHARSPCGFIRVNWDCLRTTEGGGGNLINPDGSNQFPLSYLIMCCCKAPFVIDNVLYISERTKLEEEDTQGIIFSVFSGSPFSRKFSSDMKTIPSGESMWEIRPRLSHREGTRKRITLVFPSRGAQKYPVISFAFRNAVRTVPKLRAGKQTRGVITFNGQKQ